MSIICNRANDESDKIEVIIDGEELPETRALLPENRIFGWFGFKCKKHCQEACNVSTHKIFKYFDHSLQRSEGIFLVTVARIPNGLELVIFSKHILSTMFEFANLLFCKPTYLIKAIEKIYLETL